MILYHIYESLSNTYKGKYYSKREALRAVERFSEKEGLQHQFYEIREESL